MGVLRGRVKQNSCFCERGTETVTPPSSQETCNSVSRGRCPSRHLAQRQVFQLMGQEIAFHVLVTQQSIISGLCLAIPDALAEALGWERAQSARGHLC